MDLVPLAESIPSIISEDQHLSRSTTPFGRSFADLIDQARV